MRNRGHDGCDRNRRHHAPRRRRRTELIFADPAFQKNGSAAALLDAAEGAKHEFERERCLWREDVSAPGQAVLFMPIQRKAGHSRLVLGVIFVVPGDAVRERAEALYLQRKPFAVGYFQLWQQNRMLAQRTRALEAVLEQTAIGVILLDQRGHVALPTTPPTRYCPKATVLAGATARCAPAIWVMVSICMRT